MLKFYSLILLVFIGAFASVAAGQKVLDKPIDQWSRKDAMDILTSSPWAKIYSSNEGAASAAATEALRAQSDNSLRGRERSRSERAGGFPPVVFRLHSGLPIRLALIRLNQIAANYDKMDAKGRTEFDESARKLLECAACQSYYIITVTKAPNPSGQEVEEAIFEGMKLEQMKGNVSLRNEKGETRQPVQFIAPLKRGDSAVFVFSKKDEKGNLLLSKDSKSVSIVFDSAFLTTANRFAYLLPKSIEFEVSKITVADNVVF